MNTEPNKEPEQSATSDKVIAESRSKGSAEEGQSRPKPRGYGLFSGLAIGAFLLGIVAVSVGVFLWYSLAVTNRLEMAETVARAELIAEEFDLFEPGSVASFQSRQHFFGPLMKIGKFLKTNSRCWIKKLEHLY